LKADGEIDDVQVGRGTGKAAVGSSPSARFAGVVAGPADAHLVGERARRAATNASAVKTEND